MPAEDSTATDAGGCAKSDVDVVIAQAPPEIALLAPLEEMDPTVSLTSFRSKTPAPVTDTDDKFGIEPEPASLRVPAEIAVELVKVLTASVTKTPEPDLVKVEIGESIGSFAVMLPAPVKVIAGVPLVASNALPEATSKVNVPVELPIVAAALNMTTFVTVLLLARLSNAPEPEPLPPIVKGSETESPEPSK